MFSSSHDGEVANAARMAEKLVKARGETWETVIKNGYHHQPSPPPPPKPRQPAQPTKTQDWKFAVYNCMSWKMHLSNWENEFLASLFDRPRSDPLTPKQQATLNKIIAKIDTLKGMNW